MTDKEQTVSNINDEIDLKDLLRAILDTKVWVVAALLLTSLAYWALVVVMNLAKPEIHRYESRIEFVFLGANNEKYPNGSPFSLSDVIAPVVLNRVYEKDGLAEFTDRQTFVGSFTIEPYTPGRQFILTKYMSLLDNKALSPPEIEELQAQFESELRMSSLDSATLIFTSNGDSGIPAQLIETMLREIPAEWSRHMINDRGVTRSDRQIYSSKVVNSEMIEGLDYLIMFELILERVRLLEENINTIKAMPNGLVVIDDKTGSGLPDLERSVEDIRRYQIGPLLTPIRTLGIAKDVGRVSLYFDNELTELARTTRVMEAKRKNLELVYQNYIQFEMAGGSSTGEGVSTGSIIPQFGAEFLDRIMELTNMGADLDYRQGLNTALLEMSNRLAEAEGERERIELLVNALKNQKDEKVTEELRQTYESKLLSEMPALLGELKDAFDVCTRLYLKLSADQLGSAGELYRNSDGAIDISVSNNILNFSNIRMFLIVCFLVMVLVLPLSMVRNSLRK
jgi:hypothetical protein